MEKRDFQKAKYIALDTISEWCPNYAEGTVDAKGECWMLNPLRPDNSTGSFSINTESGMYNDFASGDHGDALDLYSKVRGISILDAHDELIKNNPEPDYSGVDLSALLASLDGPKVQGATAQWKYDDGQGCVFWIVRKDLPNGDKSIRPWRMVDGVWAEKKPTKPPSGYPLLNLEKVKHADTVVLVEGEKTASAIPSKWVVTTFSGGAQSCTHTNYAPLKGKKVILWPDNDDPGREAMGKIKKILDDIGCIVSIVKPEPDWPEKCDAADFDEASITKAIEGAEDISAPKKDMFPLTAYGDMDLSPPSWLIKNWIEDDCLICVFGASGHGKSYFVMDVAASIASGTDFHSKQTKKQGAIVYIAGEGHKGLARRLRAWEIFHKRSLKDAPFIISHKPAALCDEDFMAYVTESIRMAGEKYGRIALIIIDTWARNMAGNENDTSDTSQAIRAVDDLRHIYGCSAIIVHHSGKADSENGRGSSALRGALDAEYKVSLDKSQMTVVSTKMKDGTIPDPMTFNMYYVDLGMKDDDGMAVFSSAIQEIDLNDMPGIKGTKAGKGAVQVAVESYIEAHEPCSEEEVYTSLTAEHKRDSINRAIKSLIESRKITLFSGFFRIFRAENDTENDTENDWKKEIEA
jgi:5S rRNA maturation endonuclease (ribonuclease M5)